MSTSRLTTLVSLIVLSLGLITAGSLVKRQSPKFAGLAASCTMTDAQLNISLSDDGGATYKSVKGLTLTYPKNKILYIKPSPVNGETAAKGLCGNLHGSTAKDNDSQIIKVGDGFYGGRAECPSSFTLTSYEYIPGSDGQPWISESCKVEATIAISGVLLSPTPTKTPTPQPTIPSPATPPITPKPTPTTIIRPTATPVVIIITATPGPTNKPGDPNQCGGSCGSNFNCDSNLFCYKQDPSNQNTWFCRNPLCAWSKDCSCISPTPTRTPTPRPTTRPRATATPRPNTTPTVTPSPTPTTIPLATATPTPVPTTFLVQPQSCIQPCSSNDACDPSLICFSGFCRNPLCITNTDCSCATNPALVTPTPTTPLATPTPTPKSSGGSGAFWWLLLLVIVGLIIFIFYRRRRYQIPPTLAQKYQSQDKPGTPPPPPAPTDTSDTSQPLVK